MNNVPEILSLLSDYLAEFPDIRFGQLITNTIRRKDPTLVCPALYYISNEDLVNLLAKELQETKNNYVNPPQTQPKKKKEFDSFADFFIDDSGTLLRIGNYEE